LPLAALAGILKLSYKLIFSNDKIRRQKKRARIAQTNEMTRLGLFCSPPPPSKAQKPSFGPDFVVAAHYFVLVKKERRKNILKNVLKAQSTRLASIGPVLVIAAHPNVPYSRRCRCRPSLVVTWRRHCCVVVVVVVSN
jgi:hypothetical protein